jgi:hypothetical protein
MGRESLDVQRYAFLGHDSSIRWSYIFGSEIGRGWPFPWHGQSCFLDETSRAGSKLLKRLESHWLASGEVGHRPCQSGGHDREA